MNNILFYLKSALFLGSLYAVRASSERDGWVEIKLEHCLTPSSPCDFVERSNITIQSLRIGQATINQRSLTLEQQNQLQDLAAKNQFYQVRSTVTSSDGTKNSFLSTIKACMLAEAELNDIVAVSLDYSGRVIGVAVVIASKSTCEGSFVSLNKLKEFTTTVHIKHSQAGPEPDTKSFIQKQKLERENRERGEVKDNRSMLAKYWMYIVPFVVLLMISSITNPEANGGAAQR